MNENKKAHIDKSIRMIKAGEVRLDYVSLVKDPVNPDCVINTNSDYYIGLDMGCRSGDKTVITGPNGEIEVLTKE